MNDAIEKWRSRWENSLLEVLIFQSISAKPRYGGELIEMAQEKLSTDIKIATVYAILKRTKKMGLLDDFLRKEKDDVTRGKKRRYYRMNENGKQYFNSIVSTIDSNLEFLQALSPVEIYNMEVK